MNNNGDGVDPRSYLSNNFNHQVAANFASLNDSVPLNLHHATVGSVQSPPPGVDPQMFLSLMRGRQFLNANVDGNLPLNLRQAGLSGGMDDRYAANFAALFGGYPMEGVSGVGAGQQRSSQRTIDDRSQTFSPHSFSPGLGGPSNQMQAAAALAAAQRSFSPGGYESPVFSGAEYSYEHGASRQTATNRDSVDRNRALERQTFSPQVENLTQNAQMQSAGRSKANTAYRANLEQGNYISSPPPPGTDNNRYSSPAPDSFPSVNTSAQAQLQQQRVQTPTNYQNSNLNKFENRTEVKVGQYGFSSNNVMQYDTGISNQYSVGSDGTTPVNSNRQTSTPVEKGTNQSLLLAMPELSTLTPEALADESVNKGREFPSDRSSVNNYAISESSSAMDNSMNEADLSSETCVCPVCDMQLSDAESMKEHMLAVHNVQSIAPEAPEDGVNSRSSQGDASQGDESMADVKPVVNIQRFDVFSVPENIFTKFSCVDCGAEFKSKDKLIVHVRKHTGQDTLLCTICGKSFFKTDKLARHMLVHSGERPYICRHCGASFTRSDKLRAHLKARHDDLSYTCRICRESFEDVLALKLHLSKRTCRAYLPTESEEEERIRKERELLESAFDEITSQIGDPEMDISMMLNRDRLVAKFEETLKVGGTLDPAALVEEVVGEYGSSGDAEGTLPMTGLFADDAARLEAEKARARTLHRKNLERVIKKINKHRTVECPHCNLRLPGSYTLTRHMRVAHSVVKSYQYKKKDKNKEKSTESTGPKPRPPRPAVIKMCQCQTCGKSFSKVDTLRRHEVTHSGERAFKCRYCDAKYSRSDRLRKHLKSAHVQAAYPCIKCDEAFDNRQDLRKHISVHRICAAPRPPERPRIRGPYRKRRTKEEIDAEKASRNLASLPSTNASMDNMGSIMYALSDSMKNSNIDPTSQSANDISAASLMTIEQLQTNGEGVFRLSSEQLSNALSLRNHLKSAFHVNKSKNAFEKPVPLNISSEVLFGAENARTASSGAMKGKRRYSKKQEYGEFPCSFCGKVFNSSKGVRKHELRHHADSIRTVREKKFECQRCGGRFARFESLLAHSKSMHAVVLYYCKPCDIVFDDEMEWGEHIDAKHDGIVANDEPSPASIFMCKLCRKVCDDRADLRRHLRMHQKKSRRFSVDDDSATSSEEEEEENEMKVSGTDADPRFKDALLSICAAREKSIHVVGQFKRGRKPVSHYLSMSQTFNIKEEPDMNTTVDEDNAGNNILPEMKVKQEMLDSSYPDYSSYSDVRVPKVKARRQKRKKAVVDDDSSSDSSSKGDGSDSDTISLDSSDYAEKDQSISDMLECKYCDQLLPDRRELREHIISQHRDRRSILKDPSAVDLRGRVGRVEGRSCCKICGKSFKKMSKLRRHVFRHKSGRRKKEQYRTKRPYKKRATMLEKFDADEDLETRARKLEAAAEEAGGEINSRGLFQCRICAMSFAMIAKLRRHVQMHSEVLPNIYTCRYCSANLENKEKLSEHMQFAHVDLKQLSCLLCMQIFDTTDKLYSHMEEHCDTRVLRSQLSGPGAYEEKDMLDKFGNELGPRNENDGSHRAVVKAEPGSPLNGLTEGNNDTAGVEIKSSHEESINVKQEVLALGTISQPSGEAITGDTKKIRGPHGGNKHLSCPICNKGMSSQHSLRRHITSAHTDERPYVCCDCPKAFSRMDKFRNHLRKHFGFIYPCTVCGATFFRWYHWKKHMLIHSITCELCGYACVNQAAMTRHIAKHTGEKQYTCTYCGKQFFRNYHLQIHVRRHTGEMPYSCDKCGKRFFRSDRLKRHLESHDRDCGLLCSTCGKSFTSALALRVHAHIHDAVTPQLCQLCNITLPSPKEMRKHRQAVHPGEIFLFCIVCGKQFMSHEELVAHTSEHMDGETPPDGYVLAPDGTLQPSADTSKTRDKPFLCSICGQTLSSRHALARHQRVHTGERNYTCQYCSHQFTTSYGLRRHVEKHEKPSNGTETKRGRKRKEGTTGRIRIRKKKSAVGITCELPMESKQEYVTDIEGIQNLGDKTQERNHEAAPSLPFSAEAGNENDSNDMFDVFQAARDLSFDTSRDLGKLPVCQFQEGEIKQELHGTGVDDSRSTQNSPFTSLIPRSIPGGSSDRRLDSYSSQFYGSIQEQAGRSAFNQSINTSSHSFSDEFRSSLGLGRPAADRLTHPSARRSDFSSSNRSRQQSSDELWSIADTSAAIERLNRSENILTHDLSRSGGISMANPAPVLQQMTTARDFYMRMGEKAGPSVSNVQNSNDPRDILRQPLDLAKIASSAGIDISHRFN